MECDFNTFLCRSCDYSSKVATIITRSTQKCVKITFHFYSVISHVVTTPLQDEYTSKIAEMEKSLLEVKKILYKVHDDYCINKNS